MRVCFGTPISTEAPGVLPGKPSAFVVVSSGRVLQQNIVDHCTLRKQETQHQNAIRSKKGAKAEKSITPEHPHTHTPATHTTKHGAVNQQKPQPTKRNTEKNRDPAQPKTPSETTASKTMAQIQTHEKAHHPWASPRRVPANNPLTPPRTAWEMLALYTGLQLLFGCTGTARLM